MLTARDEESDLLLGLGVGADDYVTKPFSIRELLARSEALLRRTADRRPKGFRFGGWLLDLGARELRPESGGEAVALSPKEFELLGFLAERSGRAQSREAIMNGVWGYGCSVTPRSIDRFVTTLRKKVEPSPEHPQFLVTVREFGYKFIGAEPLGSAS
jgi:two-component system alkaline phosphatase synthesis response regulator PhoP